MADGNEDITWRTVCKQGTTKMMGGIILFNAVKTQEKKMSGD